MDENVEICAVSDPASTALNILWKDPDIRNKRLKCWS